jgi:hypothetical protein
MHKVHKVNPHQKDIDIVLTQLRGVMLYDTTAAVQPDVQPAVVQPDVQPAVQPAVQPDVVQPAVQPDVQPAFRPALNQDPMFWCLYIMMNSTFKYDQLANRFTAEQDGKRDQVLLLRDKGKVLKQTTGLKFTGSTIEGDIMSQRMSLHAFQVLVHLNSLNAVFVNPHNRVYAEFISDAVSNKPIYCIQRTGKNSRCVSMTHATDHELTSLRATHYRVENLKKPMKAATANTVAELTEMCRRLKIQMTPKMKKQELYDEVVKQLVL